MEPTIVEYPRYDSKSTQKLFCVRGDTFFLFGSVYSHRGTDI